MSPTLTTLAEWLAGEFDNQPQAQDQPVWFVHLRVWHRPLPFTIDGHVALFCEQANALYLDKPYRQRVVILKPTADPQLNPQLNPQLDPQRDPQLDPQRDPQEWQAEYRAFKQPDRVLGAGANPDLLQKVSLEDLEILPGCQLTITYQPDRFKAEPPPDAKCCFQYNGQTRQVILGFEASPNQFWSYDRGVEPETGKLLWGAMMGPYQFQKQRSFAAELLRYSSTA